MNLVRFQIPVPQPIVGSGSRQRVPLFALPERVLGVLEGEVGSNPRKGHRTMSSLVFRAVIMITGRRVGDIVSRIRARTSNPLRPGISMSSKTISTRS
jgi:hypothetical protein